MNGNETRKKSHPDEEELIHSDDVEIIDFEEMDMSDATVIAGFPSIGMVSTIVANYLIDAFGLKQIGALNSAQFPPLSVVHTGEPLSPVRIYAGKLESGEKIAVFVSEFKPKPNLINSLSYTVINWVHEKRCNLLISPEGMVVEGEEENIAEAFAIGSTEEARAMLRERNIPQFKNGIIAGVSGVLLNIGKQAGYNVIALLAEAHPNIPDAGAAASAINVIASIIGIEINVGPLYDEAGRIEKQLQKFHKQAKPMASDRVPQPSMYG
ncbi:MAG: proteasome assembly chaperone family protein [Thermoplasmatales archaeon]|nr:MAG: proteasome assembly chaperone family protein [Thermoplasmatales archaeon]